MIEMSLRNLNRNNPNCQYFVNFDEDVFTFIVNWDIEHDKGYLSILDDSGKDIIKGVALVNNLIIRKHELPVVLMFVHNTEETYEPTIDNVADEFVLIYEDE